MIRLIFPLYIWLIIYTLCFSEIDTMFFDFCYAVQAPHLWYLYALMGVSLLVPLTSNFICNATKKELLFYIGIWGITLVFNGNFFESFLKIETDHNGLLFTNPITALLSFYGYFGYLLLGYYFRKYTLNKYVPCLLFLIACILVFMQYFWLKISIDKIIAYCSLVNVLISSSVFLSVKEFCNFYTVGDSFYRAVCKIGSLTFGIYLTHWLLFHFFYEIQGTESLNCIITSIIVFGASAIFTYMLSLAPFKKYLIG